MLVSEKSLLEFLKSDNGFGRVFKHKLVISFCEFKQSEGLEVPELLVTLLLLECEKSKNLVNVCDVFEILQPAVCNLSKIQQECGLVLCKDYWQLSSTDLLKTLYLIV